MEENKDISQIIFDRQMRIEKWNQNKLAQEVSSYLSLSSQFLLQIALCLGIGGLGSVVVLDLLRLGVKKIIMVDYDKVEYHNLNRQLLFSL